MTSSQNHRISPLHWTIYALLIVGLSATYWIYPKHQQRGAERMISWDIAGYYAYLPAIFIYQDLKNASFLMAIQKEYHPSDVSYETIALPNGNRSMKYSMGMAIQYLPAFGVAHLIASVTRYPADGYSQPYQVAMIIWSFLIALLGLFVLRLVLRRYFKEMAAALTLVGIALGTNYLNYAVFEGAMSHNFLFTLYAILLWLTLRFHDQPTRKWGVLIGLVVGLMALTRPTEIVAGLIPFLWALSRNDWRTFYKTSWKKYLIAVLACLAVGSLQLIYWKYVSDQWLVYSYESQGFDWGLPNAWRALTGYETGWLLYSPLVLFALAGFAWLWRSKHPGRIAITTCVVVFAYLTLAWSDWQYGESVGHRAFIQLYAVLAIPMAGFWTVLLRRVWTKWVGVAFLTLNIYYTVWQIYGAHGPGPYEVGDMNGRYFWAVVGQWHANPRLQVLLDIDERIQEDRTAVKPLATEGFSYDNRPCDIVKADVWCLNGENQFTPLLSAKLSNQPGWVRLGCRVTSPVLEVNKWMFTQVTLRAYREGQEIKQRAVKAERFMDARYWNDVYLDMRLPAETDSVMGYLWHAGSATEMVVDSMWVEGFHVE